MKNKEKFKLTVNLSRALGLTNGALLGAELFKENLDQKGLLNVLLEIQKLIDKSLEEINREE